MKNDYETRGEVTAIFLVRQDGEVLETLIDTADLDLVDSHSGTWHAHFQKFTNSYYVETNDYSTGRQRTMSLHRFLMGSPKGKQVDHINHDTLDNRRSINLRLANMSENQQNTRGRGGKSGIRGVYWHPKTEKWQASLCVNRKQIYVGLFPTVAEAEQAVKEARARFMPFSQEALEVRCAK